MPEPNAWPGPSGYCTLEHGGNLFPDLITRLDDSLDGYALFAVTRKTLCATVRLALAPCDPDRCLGRMSQALHEARHADQPLRRWGWQVKDLSRVYRAEARARQVETPINSAFADVMRELGFDDE